RALMINRTIESKASESATFADTLDGLSAGVFLVDPQCHIVPANVAGQAMLSEDDFLRSVAGQLVARDRQANRDLREIVACGSAENGKANAAFPLTAND